MIEGVTIKMGEKEFVIPPLNFKSLRMLEKDIAKLSSITPGESFSAEQIDSVIKVVYTCLVRNYPNLTTDEIEEMLDLANMPRVLQAIMGVSGFEQGEPAPVAASL